MRKPIIAATVLAGVGLALLFSRGPAGPEDAGSGATVASPQAPVRLPGTELLRENPADVGARGTSEAGSTPSLAESPSVADGVLEVEVLAHERPVPGAHVRLYWRGPRDPNLDQLSWRMASTGRTDAQGRARLASRPGSYLVAVRAPGYAPLLRDVVRPSGEAHTLLRLTLEPGQALTGRTVEKGSREPLPLVELVLTAHSSPLEFWQSAEIPAEERVNASSDVRGNFRVEGLAPGDYLLEARAPGHSQTVLRRVKVPSGAPLTVELLEAAVIEGFVEDAQGNPVSGAEVQVAGRTPEVTTTGSGGGFSVEVQPGPHTVSARRGSEAGALDKPVIVSAGQTVREVRVRLGQSAVLQGRVVARSTGAPIAGARVDVSPYGSNGDCGRAMTEATGEFSVGGLAPGSYDLVVTAPGFAPLTRRALTVASGESFPVELQLTGTGAVEGQVRDGAGQPVQGVQVVSTDRWGSPLEGTPAEARTDVEGHYRIEGIPGGSKSITARREGATLGLSQWVEITEGNTLRLDFTLEDLGTVEGRVRAANGQLPEEQLVVIAYPKDTFGFGPADLRLIDLDAAGTFRMTLQPGTYDLRVRSVKRPDFGGDEAERVEVQARETVHAELIWQEEVHEKDALQGIILEPDGAPSPSALILVTGEEEPPGQPLTARADERGRFSLSLSPEVAASSSRLKVVARNGGRLSEVQEAKPGERELVVKLKPAASVRGRVVSDSGGAPVKGFTVSLQPQDLQRFPFGNGTWEFPGDRFELRDVAAEPTKLVVRTADGAGGNVLVTPAAGAVAEVEVPVNGTGRVRGRVVDAVTQEPVPGILVLIVDDRPLDPDKPTGADGRFFLEGVAEGDRLLVVVRGKQYERVSLTVTEGEETDVGDIQFGP